ncbi:MAG: hypothetical protein ACQEVT_08080 [Pseudomonadota bacterium]|uniref:hypothetical protein n=1 Tax=Roseovarius TaxID=74030 RepID=UPI0022A8A76D|nr:hypothetical protein [Roseovarius sp. EGI FJ00037]MCZ0812679.1 hypothetical protein [Roseovarius sp. EGI FJ00037]
MHELRANIPDIMPGVRNAGARVAWKDSIWVTIQTNLGETALILEKFCELTQSVVKRGHQDPLN